ncbi:MAG: UDP-3-O-(3-hydroxymyristoyl)glucosamine N-acyltransferase [Myxococcota bacterium]
MGMRLSALVEAVGGRLERAAPSDGDRAITRVMTLEDADGSSISFITNLKYLDALKTTRAAAVLCDARTLKLHGELFPCPVVVTGNPYLAMAQLVTELHPAPRHPVGVNPLAVVHPEAVLGAGVTVMALACVGKARIGAGSVIYPHVFIDDDVEIGPDALIYPGCVIMRGTRVGARVILQPSCVIGSDGFGFAPDREGRMHKIPQVGNVVLGDDVEIGACTTIDRAALGSTRISNGTKLDNQVQVAHNVVLGENVVMAGQSAVAGSSRLGRSVMIGGGSGVGGHLTMHDGSKLTGGSFVMHDVPAGETWMGAPAFNHISRAKAEIHYRHLDEHVRTLKQLQKRVATLEAQLAGAPKAAGEGEKS